MPKERHEVPQSLLWALASRHALLRQLLEQLLCFLPCARAVLFLGCAVCCCLLLVFCDATRSSSGRRISRRNKGVCSLCWRGRQRVSSAAVVVVGAAWTKDSSHACTEWRWACRRGHVHGIRCCCCCCSWRWLAAASAVLCGVWPATAEQRRRERRRKAPVVVEAARAACWCCFTTAANHRSKARHLRPQRRRWDKLFLHLPNGRLLLLRCSDEWWCLLLLLDRALRWCKQRACAWAEVAVPWQLGQHELCGVWLCAQQR